MFLVLNNSSASQQSLWKNDDDSSNRLVFFFCRAPQQQPFLCRSCCVTLCVLFRFWGWSVPLRPQAKAAAAAAAAAADAAFCLLLAAGTAGAAVAHAAHHPPLHTRPFLCPSLPPIIAPPPSPTMSEAAKGVKLAEADGMMKNGDKFCKKARKAQNTIPALGMHQSHPYLTPFPFHTTAGSLQLVPRVRKLERLALSFLQQLALDARVRGSLQCVFVTI